MDDKLDNIALFKHFFKPETNHLTASESHIALCIASHRNNVSMLCCPSITTIQQKVRMAKSTVIKAISGLITKKEIVKLRPIKENTAFANNQYYFMFDISHAKEIYFNEDSIFRNHHNIQVENFELCLLRNMF